MTLQHTTALFATTSQTINKYISLLFPLKRSFKLSDFSVYPTHKKSQLTALKVTVSGCRKIQTGNTILATRSMFSSFVFSPSVPNKWSSGL